MAICFIGGSYTVPCDHTTVLNGPFYAQSSWVRMERTCTSLAVLLSHRKKKYRLNNTHRQITKQLANIK